MASSIYLYNSYDDYLSYYKGKSEQLVFQIPIIDMYIDSKNQKLFVITNQDNNAKKNIDFSRTIVHVRHDGWRADVVAYDNSVELVQYDKLIYNGKTGYIDFFPRFLKKPKYSQRIDRVVGGSSRRKYDIDYEHKFYDWTQDRINLILGEPKSGLFSRFLR